MSAHTNTRLHVPSNDKHALYSADNKPFADMFHGTQDDAKRLAVCWNLCQGFDTAHLESIDFVGDTFKDRFMGLQEELRAVPLTKKHEGMRVDYSGMLGQACRALKRSEPGKAEILRQLQDHLTEMGKRFYAGDFTVVDEFLQLYCVANEDRERVVAERNKEAA
jgi:hypothetical protein